MSFRGFTLIEVLIVAFVLSVVTLAITGLSLVITRSSIESERETVAQGLLNEKLENLRAAYNELGYEVIAYTDESALGMVKRQETVTRNNLDYEVVGHIILIDDPANGTGTTDFAQVLYKASWTSNIGDNVGYAPGVVPEVYAAPSTVVAAATFYNLKPTDRACQKGTDTCPLKCPADAPNTCPDEQGNLTKTCSPLGICPDYLTCPASGKCSDAASQAGQPQSAQPPNQAQCPNGISSIDFASEECDLSVCNDGRNNEPNKNDGADANDPQCQAGQANLTNNFDDDGNGVVDDAGENKIFFEITGCIATEESCRATGGGQQVVGVLEPKISSAQCSLDRECGIKKFLRACAADCSKVSDSDCQEKRGVECLPDQSCTLQDNENIKNPCGGPGPGAKSICAESRSGACVECVAANITRCAETAPEICRGGKKDEPAFCVCDYNRCAQCNAVNAKDDNCPKDTKPYCWNKGAGSAQDPTSDRKQCVECIRHSNCAAKGPDKPFCRTLTGGGDITVPQCVECTINEHCQEKYPNNAKPWCNSGVCSEEAACNDGKDNDGDQRIDFTGGFDGLKREPKDPGCDSFDDTTEEDFISQCIDGIDNDHDFIDKETTPDGGIDFAGGPNGEPFDPDCSSPEDDYEGGSGPRPVQTPQGQPNPQPFPPPGNVVDF